MKQISSFKLLLLLMVIAPAMCYATVMTDSLRGGGTVNGNLNINGTGTFQQINSTKLNGIYMQTTSTGTILELEGTYYDYGKYWSASNSFNYVQQLAMSSDGRIQTVINWSGPTYISTDTGKTWGISDATNSEHLFLSMSGDGRVQARSIYNYNPGGVCISTDTGATWVSRLGGADFTGISVSRDGGVITTINQTGNIYVSTDSGNTWVNHYSIQGEGDLGKGVALSYDGTIQIVSTDDAGLFVSTDTGKTFVQTQFTDIHFDGKSTGISSDGKMLISCDERANASGGVYLSSDAGQTWRIVGPITISGYGGAAISDDGNMVAVQSGYNVYVSTDAGETWGAYNLGAQVNSIAMNPSATLLVASSGNTLYNSPTPYFVNNLTLNPRGITAFNNITASTITVSACIFSDGTVMSSTATFVYAPIVSGGYVKRSGDSMTGYLNLTTFTATACMIGNSDYLSLNVKYDESGDNVLAQAGTPQSVTGEWSENVCTHAWQAIAVSSAGVRQVLTNWDGDYSGQHVWISSDSGNTWTRGSSFNNPQAVAMSADGKYILVGVNEDENYLSSNYGASFSGVGYVSSHRSKYDADMSDDGTIQVVAMLTNTGNRLHSSINTGANWSETDIGSISEYGVAVSSAGTIQSVVSTSGGIAVSTNTGATWVIYGPSKSWQKGGIAMSADGTVQAAIESSGYIWVSTDTGKTWAQKSSSKSWTDIDVSADGTRQMAVCSDGPIYASEDSGNTWAVQDSERTWYVVAMSDDGTVRTAAVSSGDREYTAVSGNIYLYEETIIGGYKPIYLNTEGGNVTVGSNSSVVTIPGTLKSYMPHGTSLPTTGYGKWAFYGDDTTGNVAVSTETVTGTWSWKYLW